MRRWMKIAGTAVGACAVGCAAAVAAGTRRWKRETARALRRLRAESPEGARAEPVLFSREELAGLPAPVTRYFEYALAPEQRLVRRARLRQAGRFSMRPGAWRPFTAMEHFSVAPRGFLWDATIRTMPLCPVRVRDGYLEGEGVTRGAIAGLVPVVDQHGTPELASGALLRYLAECVWLPTALLPSAGVQWSAVDDRTARATLTDGATTVSMDAHFGEGGEIASISAERHRDVKGTPVLTRWEGRFRDWERADGMMIPMTGEVEWASPEGTVPYWRGRIVEARYEYGG